MVDNSCFAGTTCRKKVEHHHLHHPSQVINWSILSIVLKVVGLISNVEIDERGMVGR